MAAKFRKMNMRLREGRRLLGFDVLQCDRDAPIVKSKLGSMAHFLVAVRRVAEIISCGGVSVDVKMTLDRFPSGKVAFTIPTM